MASGSCLRIGQLGNYSKVMIRMTTVYFTDGTKWSPGYFGKPDPQHPGQYITILEWRDLYAVTR